MAATICIPWLITLAVARLGVVEVMQQKTSLTLLHEAYTLLHWSYPRDMRRLRAKQEAATEAQAGAQALRSFEAGPKS